ncbi:15460_t:CDS:1, partial [Gigaspora rosea]
MAYSDWPISLNRKMLLRSLDAVFSVFTSICKNMEERNTKI